MGRKDKSKKGKGAEKTSLKTQKKLDKKLKKIEHGLGEQTIEALLDEFSKEQMKFSEVSITTSSPPSPRPLCVRSKVKVLASCHLSQFSSASIWTSGLKGQQLLVPEVVIGCSFGSHPFFFLGDSVIVDEDTNKASCISLRSNGVRPQPPRSSMAGVLHTSNRVLLFGGVHDMESDDGESVFGQFHNDLYCLDLDKAKWHPFQYASATTDAAETVNQPVEVIQPGPSSTTQISDGVFTLRLDGCQRAGTSAAASASCEKDRARQACGPRVPSSRSSAGMALLGSTLYVYGGVFETGDRKVTLNDFYCLDLANPVSWQCLYPGTQNNQEWYGSDLEDEEEEEEEIHSGGDNPHAGNSMEVASGKSSSEDEDEDSDDDDDEEIVEDAPVPEGEETYSVYWDRTRSFWYQLMARGLDRHDVDVVALTAGREPSPAVDSLAQQFAKNIFEKNTQSSA